MERTVCELFAGVGGFRCGLNHVDLKDGKAIEKGNWECLWANQWEPATKSQEACDCYAMRFGADDVSNTDISEETSQAVSINISSNSFSNATFKVSKVFSISFFEFTIFSP